MLSIDNFFLQAMYNKKYGYYATKNPLGYKSDFITSPLISTLFSEMILIWLVSTWQNLGKPKKINIVELGPGDGTMAKIIIESSQKFKDFSNAAKFFLYENSLHLIQFQKKKISNRKIKWIKNFSKISNHPTLFIGNEYFDSIPIKQFKRHNGKMYEKKLQLKNDEIFETFQKASNKDKKLINKFKCLKNNYFFEFPKLGLSEIDKIIKTLKQNSGAILLIDYGYLKQTNLSSLQSIRLHKFNKIYENIGKSDVTSHVNFGLLKEYFLGKGFKVKNTINQSMFLKKIGILERANQLSLKMNFKKKTDLYFRLQRLLDPKIMGHLFKVFLSYNSVNNKYLGF